MTGPVEEKIAEVAARSLPGLVGKLYRIETEGKDFLLNERGPAVIAVKHTHMMDFFASTYVFIKLLKRRTMIPLKKGLFRNDLVALILRELGGVPVIRPTDEGYSPSSYENVAMAREFIKVLKAGHLWAYCPEGTRARGKIGPNFYVQPIMLAAKRGVDTYVTGIEYKAPPQISLWTPFTTIIVRNEPYDARGKSELQIAAEVRQRMAVLSGIKQI
ncbi:1-acyl-sn-glycerol-3-phosphate acyltransferase [Candidatus Woesearchaeota archaeon]|nr:1-acyl-sn-glycerol-3-phosphate acyltransferase [Candidatus Woesearchaeota archaeon]